MIGILFCLLLLLAVFAVGGFVHCLCGWLWLRLPIAARRLATTFEALAAWLGRILKVNS